MKLDAARFEMGARGCFAQILDEVGNVTMWTGEHCYQQADGTWAPKTLAGTYTCKLGQHILPTGEKLETYEVLGVEGHTGILFVHPGNLPQIDSNGCFICGQSMGFVGSARAVIMSRIAFHSFQDRMRGIDTFELTITDPV